MFGQKVKQETRKRLAGLRTCQKRRRLGCVITRTYSLFLAAGASSHNLVFAIFDMVVLERAGEERMPFHAKVNKNLLYGRRGFVQREEEERW